MSVKIVIIGTSQFSSLMRNYVEQDGVYEVVAYSVENKYKCSEEFEGCPLVPFERIAQEYPCHFGFQLLNTIGYTQMNRVRARIQEKGENMGYKFMTYVHPSAVVNSPLGQGCIVLEHVSIGFRNSIGKGCLFWMNSVLAHDCCMGAHVYCAPNATVCGHVKVGNRCFLGAGSVLRNGINVADECVIGAGVYMNQSIVCPGDVYRSTYPVFHNKKAHEVFS